MLITRPHLLAFVRGSASRVVWNAELRLMAIMASHFLRRKLIYRCHRLNTGVVDQHSDHAELFVCHVHHAPYAIGNAYAGSAIDDFNFVLGGKFGALTLNLSGIAELVDHQINALPPTLFRYTSLSIW